MVTVSGEVLDRAKKLVWRLRQQGQNEDAEAVDTLLAVVSEREERRQAYELYYASRGPEEAAEELALLADFAPAEAEVMD